MDTIRWTYKDSNRNYVVVEAHYKDMVSYGKHNSSHPKFSDDYSALKYDFHHSTYKFEYEIFRSPSDFFQKTDKIGEGFVEVLKNDEGMDVTFDVIDKKRLLEEICQDYTRQTLSLVVGLHMYSRDS